MSKWNAPSPLCGKRLTQAGRLVRSQRHLTHYVGPGACLRLRGSWLRCFSHNHSTNDACCIVLFKIPNPLLFIQPPAVQVARPCCLLNLPQTTWLFYCKCLQPTNQHSSKLIALSVYRRICLEMSYIQGSQSHASDLGSPQASYSAAPVHHAASTS